jgi:hypothetical protein
MKNPCCALAAALAAVLFVAAAAAQTGAPPQSDAGSVSRTAPQPAPAPPDPTLAPLQQAAETTVGDLARVRIEKWKTDAASKQQLQGNADSVVRNLTSALPALIQQARNSPGTLGPTFKLYRNVNAVYEVLATLAESAGAFGPKTDFQALSADVAALDQARRALADRLEMSASSADSELTRLRAQSRALQAAAAAAAQPPKKIVVDDTEPEKKTTKKKPATTAKPASTPKSQ